MAAIDSIDPITLEVIKHALASIGDEMALVIMRSGYSPVVRDTMDYSTALMDADGKIIAQGLGLRLNHAHQMTIAAMATADAKFLASLS